jgi:guanine deaminase
MATTDSKKAIYCGAFVHCATPEKLDICNSAAIGVNEEGIIAFVDRDVKDFDVYKSKEGWTDAKIIRLEHWGFFFPGFIGMFNITILSFLSLSIPATCDNYIHTHTKYA